MLSDKELMGLEDFLGTEQTCGKAMNYFASTIQDSQAKQMFQQMAKKSQQRFQTISKHLNSGQTLQ